MESWEREQKERKDEIESRRLRSARRKKKWEKARRERQFFLARRRDGAHPHRKHAPVTGPAACPSCGDSERLYTIETAVGYSRGPARFENGILHFDHGGMIEIDWSVGTTTAGVACDCGWRGALGDLVLARG